MCRSTNLSLGKEEREIDTYFANEFLEIFAIVGEGVH